LQVANETLDPALELPRERLSQVRAEQIRALYRQAPLAILSGLVVPIPLLIVFWGAISEALLVSWYASMAVVAAVRSALVFAYRRAAPEAADLAAWGNLYVLGTIISGSVWGAAGVLLFVPGALDYQFFLDFILAGMCTGSVASLGAFLPAFYAFLLPTMLPFLAIAVVQGDTVHLAVVFANVFYLLAMSVFARNFNRSLTESLRLQFENLRLVDEVTAKKDEAERANVAKSRFLAAASHDLRQPLHAMALFVSALQEKSRESETRRILDQLTLSVEALEGLFHALLDVSKLDAGIVRPEVRGFSVQALFDRIGREFAEEAADKGLRLRLMPTRAFVHSDATLLERILRNLVSNAIHYTRTGGVVVGCRRRGGDLRIDVCDSGIGIDPSHFTDIFQEFYQVGNPERDRDKGLGLGLAIVDRLARLLRHPVTVVSVPSRGSVFSVTVPRGDTAAIEPEPPQPAEIIGGNLGGALLVVIDDERAVLEGMREVLQQWGCRPLLAGSADEALAQLAAAGQRPTAVIADYRLRAGETGIAAIERIQSEYGADIPGVIITGDTAPDRLREAEASGYHLLHKPVRPARLRALLSFLLRA